MLSVRTAGMDETIRSALCWNETEPRTLGTSLEQRAAPGAKMSLYYPSWRTLHIFFAAITAVLTQGRCPGSHWLCAALCLNRNCPSGTSVKPVYKTKRDERTSWDPHCFFKCLHLPAHLNSWCQWAYFFFFYISLLSTCDWWDIGLYSAKPAVEQPPPEVWIIYKCPRLRHKLTSRSTVIQRSASSGMRRTVCVLLVAKRCHSSEWAIKHSGWELVRSNRLDGCITTWAVALMPSTLLHF